jgi:DsbC/DsbD-like thiol-disulfide interchange protein
MVREAHHRVNRRLMIKSLFRLGFVTAILLAVAATLSLAGRANAADASPWNGGKGAAARLIAASATEAGGARVLRAGVEIRLEPGWKTYWRYPGDSGVPPRFDFDRSDNVASVSVRWPAPHGFADADGHSIGYSGSVIFPLQVTPRDATRPVMLRLHLDYAVCEKLCVPVEAKAELMLFGTATAYDKAVAGAEARVPRPAQLGDAAPLSIRQVRREADYKYARILVDVAAPAGRTVELFVEGPTPDWALPLPQPVDGAPAGITRFAFDLAGLPSDIKADGAALALTAVAGDDAIEVTTRLD